MNEVPIVVVKVGGSLFDWPALPQRLQEWLRDRPAGIHVLVAGGGALCDVIRQADARFNLGQERAHWLCIDALAISARLLTHMLQGVPLIDSLSAASGLRNRHSTRVTVVFDPQPFLVSLEVDQLDRPLPHHWDVTSDSIAAHLAERLGAFLVLLKSSDAPATSVEAASSAGFVDAYFPHAARNVSQIGWVNLRRGNEVVPLSRTDR